MKTTTFQRIIKLAAERDLNLARPCLELGVSMRELETRIDTGDLKALETCAAWIGVPITGLLLSGN